MKDSRWPMISGFVGIGVLSVGIISLLFGSGLLDREDDPPVPFPTTEPVEVLSESLIRSGLARIVAPISGALPISGGLQLIVEREEPSPDTLFLLRSDETGGLISVGELQFADGRAEINVTDLECARPGATQLSFVVVTSAELEPEIFIAGANVSNLDNLWTVEDSTVVELVTCLGSNGTIRLSYQVAEGDTVALTVLDNLIEDEAFEAGNLDTFSQSPSWLADEPSVLYYADATEDLAAKVADRLSESLQQEFAVVLGAGQGVTDEQRGRLLIVHVPES